MSDSHINDPAHYTQGDIHCIDAMLSALGKPAVISFCIANSFKYVWRCTTHTAGLEQNAGKAVWYLTKAIELSRSSPES